MKVLSYILTALLIISLYFNINYYSESQTYKERENDFSSRNENLKRQLETESRKRVVLADSISDLTRSYQDLVLQLEQNKKELKSIKGRYNNISDNELSDLMERRVK